MGMRVEMLQNAVHLAPESLCLGVGFALCHFAGLINPMAVEPFFSFLDGAFEVPREQATITLDGFLAHWTLVERRNPAGAGVNSVEPAPKAGMGRAADPAVGLVTGTGNREDGCFDLDVTDHDATAPSPGRPINITDTDLQAGLLDWNWLNTKGQGDGLATRLPSNSRIELQETPLEEARV